MKLSISTLGCPEWSFDKIVSQFSSLGVQGIEVRGIGGIMNFADIPELCEDNIENTLKILKDKNLEFICFGSSASFHDIEKQARGIEEAKQTVDAAQRAGVPYIRVFGHNVDRENEAQSISNIIVGIRQVCEYAKGRGVCVNLEIHGDVNTPKRLAQVIDGLKDFDNFGIIWDVCHTFSSCGNSIDEIYGVIAPYVRHVHLKDAVKENGSVVIRTLGEGDIDIKQIVKRLLDDGYDGYFSFEHEKKWHKELPEPEIEFPKFVEYVKKLNL